MFDMAPLLSVSPLHIHLTDPARGCAPTTTVDEEEMTVNLTDVLEYQLLPPGFRIEVRTELTSPVEKVGGQEDGGGETGLLGHTVGLLQVGLNLLHRQEVPRHTGELKYQEILRRTFLITIIEGLDLPCSLHSGMPRPCGRVRCGQSSPVSAPDLDSDSPDTAPASGSQTKTCSGPN